MSSLALYLFRITTQFHWKYLTQQLKAFDISFINFLLSSSSVMSHVRRVRQLLLLRLSFLKSWDFPLYLSKKNFLPLVLLPKSNCKNLGLNQKHNSPDNSVYKNVQPVSTKLVVKSILSIERLFCFTNSWATNSTNQNKMEKE